MTGQKKVVSLSHFMWILGIIGAFITIFIFMTGISSFSEIGPHVKNIVNYEPKSNLEVSVIDEPPTKFSKSSSIVYEFNICNNGKTGEEYNYSLEMNNMRVYAEERGEGLLNDGDKCVEIIYDLHPKSLYFSPNIDFSIKVYSKSLNKLLFDKTYKYSLNEEGFYDLK